MYMPPADMKVSRVCGTSLKGQKLVIRYYKRRDGAAVYLTPPPPHAAKLRHLFLKNETNKQINEKRNDREAHSEETSEF